MKINANKQYLDTVEKLNLATEEYDLGHPIMSDKEWDDLYFAVKDYEEKTGISINGSPTQTINFSVQSKLEKVEHNHPLLSLDKTKNIDDIISFIGKNEGIMMLKLDGLTCSLTYENGILVGAETRGNGIIGENILHNAKVINNIPKTIPIKDRVIVDGEVICTYDDFGRFFSEDYKNPRNFAAGSIRLLDSRECANRKLKFIVWDIIEGIKAERLSEKLSAAFDLGFSVVPYITPLNSEIKNNLDILSKWCPEYPCDGLVFKYNDCSTYDAAGRTDHHFKGGLAYKFYDETYDTTLINIEWTMGRTGVLTPVAIFNPVEIEGTIVSRASLHNFSVLKETLGCWAFEGQKISIAKMNMIIPQIVAAEKWHINKIKEQNKKIVFDYTKSIICPYCGENTIISVSDSGVENIICGNDECSAKLINILDHYCGKKGLDIKGLSKATLEKLINWGWISNVTDIYTLSSHANDWIQKSGFGLKSVQNIIEAIEESKETNLSQFISALGIPLIGKRVAEEICTHINSYEEFKELIKSKFDFSNWNTFGEEKSNAILKYDYTYADFVYNEYIHIKKKENNDNIEQTMNGLIFVVTGKVNKFKNRDEIKSIIEAAGGKVASSVTSKTDYLINNDINSNSSKNVTAQRLGKPIITEEEFINLFNVAIN